MTLIHRKQIFALNGLQGLDTLGCRDRARVHLFLRRLLRVNRHAHYASTRKFLSGCEWRTTFRKDPSGLDMVTGLIAADRESGIPAVTLGYFWACVPGYPVRMR